MKNLSGIVTMIAYTFVLGFILAAGSGCAANTTATRTGPYAMTYRTDIRPGGEARPRDPRAAAPVMVAPATGLAVAPAGMVPPPRPVPMGPPQHFAWLHTPPYGCESGPLALEIHNQSAYFLTVILDGTELRVRGSGGELPHLPPGERAYVCLNELGEHSVAGVAYAGRYGALTEVERFSVRHRFTSRSMNVSGRQAIHLSDAYITWH